MTTPPASGLSTEVPPPDGVPAVTQVHAAARLLADTLRSGGAVVLSGAGISTEAPSSIPDYRGPTGVARGATPMTFQELTGSPEAQRRYWARSFAGWPVMRDAVPNAGHAAVARLQGLGLVDGVITQNVDRLHQAAGATAVVDLHGTLARVVCLACRDVSDRDVLQARLAEANPGFDPEVFTGSDGDTAQVRPDGDVELVESMVERIPHGAVPGVRRGPAQAGRGVLRRERAGRPGRALLRARRRRPHPAGARLVAHGDVGLPVRAARRQGAAATSSW